MHKAFSFGHYSHLPGCFPESEHHFRWTFNAPPLGVRENVNLKANTTSFLSPMHFYFFLNHSSLWRLTLVAQVMAHQGVYFPIVGTLKSERSPSSRPAYGFWGILLLFFFFFYFSLFLKGSGIFRLIPGLFWYLCKCGMEDSKNTQQKNFFKSYEILEGTQCWEIEPCRSATVGTLPRAPSVSD